jgi:hypothetical protein
MPYRRPSLRFDIAGALIVKAALLTILYYVCFGPSHQIKVDPQSLSQHLLASSTSVTTR